MQLSPEGAKVVITARREAQLEEVAAKIREAGGEVLPVVSDISMPEDVASMLLFSPTDESRAITGRSIVTDFGSAL